MAHTATATKLDHALQNVRGHLENLVDLAACHECMTDEGRPADLTWEQRRLLIKELGFTGDNWTDTAEAIEQWADGIPLSLLFRSDWFSTAQEAETAEFELLLSTGGPALRIIGAVTDGELQDPVMQMQDWGTPWIDVDTNDAEDSAMAWFISCFHGPEA